MSKESDNKAIVGRWFTDFWGERCNLGIVDGGGLTARRGSGLRVALSIRIST
jgi:hypothetical protein